MAECVELIDKAFIDVANMYGSSKRKHEVADHLFFKLQGPSASSIQETASIVREVVQKHGGKGWMLAKDEAESEEMWADRKNAHYIGLAWAGEGAKGWATDVW